jgi:protein-S-isoprenylcysteine O-methyltransferase Ste14
MNASIVECTVFVGFILVALGLRVREMWQKRGTERGAVTMNWSFHALVGMAALVYVATVAEFFFAPRVYRWGIGVTGMALYASSVWLRLAAIRALGRYWSLHIEIRAQHPLVREGPYKFVRHPAYVAFVLEVVGVALAGNAWVALALAVLGYVPLLVWRQRREDVALIAQIGEPYRAYQREVGAFCPWRALCGGKAPGA